MVGDGFLGPAVEPQIPRLGLGLLLLVRAGVPRERAISRVVTLTEGLEARAAVFNAPAEVETVPPRDDEEAATFGRRRPALDSLSWPRS